MSTTTVATTVPGHLRTRTNPVIVLSFLLPSLVGFALFILLPAVATLGFSFTNFSGGFKNLEFVGLRNYARALTSESFYQALWVTFKFVVLSVGFQLVLAFVFALLLHLPMRGRNLLRGTIFLPSVLSPVAISLVFALMMHPQNGALNQLLELVGLQPLKWLASKDSALNSIILVTVWQQTGYYMVIFLAGLLSISPTLYEVAELDGATWWHKLTRVTIPMLTPTAFFALTMAIIKAFQVFDQVFVMTGGQDGGGPSGSTTVLVFDIYIQGFVYFNMGYAATEAVLLLAIVLFITVVQYRQQAKWVSYDLS
ncbi:MAG: carbohydrate ABC transporter permease [Spirochaetota bacterium]